MQNHLWKITASILILALASLACGINVSSSTPSPLDSVGTTVAKTLAAYTEAASHPGPEAATDTPALAATPTATVQFEPLASATPVFTPTGLPTSSSPENALVTTSTLCWLGPGKAYEVSSSITKNTRVQLLGRGDMVGWLIVRNPKYHDPCWMPESYLQVDAGVNVLSLPIYSTPPTPTSTP